MKKLIILRHGKSDWSMEDEDDFDRKLTNKGENNAAEIALFVIKKEGKPDLIFSSNARRAADTARIFAVNSEIDSANILFDNHLYLASGTSVLRLIKSMDDKVNFLLIVGHNPGLTDLINQLGVRLDNLPTASGLCFYFETDSWQQINIKNAHFKWFQPARNL